MRPHRRRRGPRDRGGAGRRRLARLALVGWMLAEALPIEARDLTYEPNPLLPRLHIAIRRVEREGARLPTETRLKLLAEGKRLLSVEERYVQGNTPIQHEIRRAARTGAALAAEERRLAEAIRAFNADPEASGQTEGQLQEAVAQLRRRFKAHKRYLDDDLNPRIREERRAVSARYIAFARKVEAALLPPGRRPSLQPFQPLWERYRERYRQIAAGLAPAENRCAMVLSLALDLRPRAGEATLRDLADPPALLRILQQIRGQYPVAPEVKDAELGTRFYIRARELADRLRHEWGEPEIWEGGNAEAALPQRRGVVFFEGGYGSRGTVDHIDLWNADRQGRDRLGAEIDPAFATAQRVWFWEVPD